MNSDKINLWLAINAENFNPQDLIQIKEKLEQISDDKSFILQSTSFEKPTIMLVIAIFLGWERFWLDDIALGVLKIITCYGCGIWWLIDIFTAKERTRKYNFQKFIRLVNYI
ncbi:MAG: TM2 domain-containing protein [Bacteroidales bacterium]|jgi:hypothetical protein|nr:TM2 domain-containing protein [Bacteroidales bacterium]